MYRLTRIAEENRESFDALLPGGFTNKDLHAGFLMNRLNILLNESLSEKAKSVRPLIEQQEKAMSDTLTRWKSLAK